MQADDLQALRISAPDPLPGYRPCVGLMVINRDGLIFVGDRLGTVGGWQMPQGGIDRGEQPQEAALRELLEEIGTNRVELLIESSRWYAYDLPRQYVAKFHKGRFRGQTQRWFAYRFLGADSDIDIATPHPEFSRWRWAPPEEVVEQIIPFKRAVYQAVFEEFGPHLSPSA